ncbi:MAG: polysaccharide deacetylase family protein [Clostridia bacterium]|nr:polysaccharide deacetylase family protein [Clostridia bacterium]
MPTAKVSAAPLYSGTWNDGNWALQGVSVSADGTEAVVSGSGGVITSNKTYNLADSFTWSVDYSITNNYNCREADYTAISVGDLSLRISSSRNFDAGGRNESFTSNKPYETGFSLYWQDKPITADYSYNCFFTTIYVSYKMEYNKGDIIVTRKSAEDERAVLRVSAANLKKQIGALPKFNGVNIKIDDRETAKATKLRNFTLSSGVSGTEYLNYGRLVGKSSMGDVSGNGFFSRLDLLLVQQALIGDISADGLNTATTDANKNGKIDSCDALCVFQMLEQVKKYDGPTTDKFVALTFDDGPSYDTTTRLLEVAERYNVPFTFFVIGKNIDGNSYNLTKAKELGCEIGSHSWSHPNFKTLHEQGKEADILKEVNDTTAKIKEITGEDTKLFRFPLVYSSYPVYQFEKYNFGMTYICGNFVGIKDTDTIKSRTDILKKLFKQDGSIILMHDSGGNYRTVEAVEECLPLMLEQGTEPVTVSQLALLNGKIMDKGKTLYTKFKG